MPTLYTIDCQILTIPWARAFDSSRVILPTYHEAKTVFQTGRRVLFFRFAKVIKFKFPLLHSCDQLSRPPGPYRIFLHRLRYLLAW